MPEIAIDACVFIHLLNPEKNPGSHIDGLLRQLYKDCFMLLVDSTGKIGKDYEAQVNPMIRKSYDTGSQLPLLRYWMQKAERRSVDVDLTDPLMKAIKGIIHEVAEHADRAFVYVACRQNTVLITNDETHILNRRVSLLKKTKKYRGKGTDILSSEDAAIRYCGGLV